MQEKSFSGHRYRFMILAYLLLIMTFALSPSTVGAFSLNLFKAKVPGGEVSQAGTTKSDGDVASDLFQKARKLAAEGRYTDAIVDLTDAIARNPGDAVLYFERGCVYYYLMLSETEDTNQAESSSPHGDKILQPEAGEPSGDAPPILPADLCIRALADFNQAIAMKANYDVFYFMRGLLVSSDICPEQNFWKAIAEYDRALRINPKNAVYHLERGLAWAKLKQYREAVNNIDRAILLEPANYYFHYEKGLIWEKMGLFSQAAGSYKAVLELAPPERLMDFTRDLIRARKGNRVDLIADYTELIAKRPAVSAFYIQRAFFYGDLKKYHQAIQDVTTALALQNDRRDLFFMRGKLYDQEARKAEALRDFEKACALDHPAACYYRQMLGKKAVRGEPWISFWTSRDKRKYFYLLDNMEEKDQVAIARVRIEPDGSVNGNPVATQRKTAGKNGNSYLLEWWEFICSRAEFRIATVKKIGFDDRIIASYPDYEKNFRPVVAGSVSGKLLNIVCTKKADK